MRLSWFETRALAHRRNRKPNAKGWGRSAFYWICHSAPAYASKTRPEFLGIFIISRLTYTALPWLQNDVNVLVGQVCRRKGFLGTGSLRCEYPSGMMNVFDAFLFYDIYRVVRIYELGLQLPIKLFIMVKDTNFVMASVLP